MEQGRPPPRTFQSFRDQVHKCTTEKRGADGRGLGKYRGTGVHGRSEHRRGRGGRIPMVAVRRQTMVLADHRAANDGSGRRAVDGIPYQPTQGATISEVAVDEDFAAAYAQTRSRWTTLGVHLSTYYLKYQIIVLKFIVGQERQQDRPPPRTFQSFRDQVPKCTAEARRDEVAVDEVPAGRGLAPARWTIKRGAWWMV